MVRVLCALVLATAASGCAQLFGFDETDPDPRTGLRLEMVRRYYGATIVDEAMDLTTETATVLVEDPAEPSGLRSVPALIDGGSAFFAADIPAADAAAIRFTLPDDDVIRIYAFHARRLRALYAIAGRPGLEPAPPNAAIDLSVTLDVGYNSEALHFYAVGPWAIRGFPEVPVPAMGITAWDPPAVPWAQWSRFTARPLERIEPADSLWILRYAGAVLSGWVSVPAFEQTDGVDPTITATLATLTLDRTLAATLAVAGTSTRYAGTRPAVGTLSMSWGIAAAPGADAGSGLGPALHMGGGLGEAEVAINAMYGNPFPWPEVITLSSTETRDYTPPALLATTLYAGMSSVAAASPSPTFDLPQALPLMISIGGRALTADTAAVMIDRTRAVPVSFVVDRDASCDVYTATLDELIDTGGGAVGRVTRVALSGDQPRWLVPNDLFTTGALYTFRIQCRLGGTPNLAMGDLVTRSWPVHHAYLDSAAFVVSEVTP